MINTLTLADQMKKIEDQFHDFHTAQDWAIKNGAEESLKENMVIPRPIFKFPDGSAISIDPGFGHDHILVVKENS